MSNTLLFDRRAKLLVATPVSTPNDFKTVTSDVIEINAGKTNDKKTTGLRVKFSVTKTLKKEPNTAEIEVFNLADSTRKSLQKGSVKIVLDAGYEGPGVFRVFSGDVRTVDHVRTGADWNTTFKCGDGERAYQFARVNESFAPGSPISSVMNVMVGKLGVENGSKDAIAKLTGSFDQGYVASGSARAVVNEMVTAIGKTWSIQDGVFQLLDKDATTSGEVLEITPQTGLIGSPEMGTPDKKGKPSKVKIKCLLVPMKPGRRVKLKSERYDGLVRVVSCKFTGDTAGGEWYTEIEGTLLK